jgi:hypothetical protein
VNVGGPALTIDGNDWLEGPTSTLPSYDTSAGAVTPDTAAAQEAMLRDGIAMEDTSFSYPVENGRYLVLPYVLTYAATSSGVLTVQGQPRDRFRPRSYLGGSAWSPMGPYEANVTDGELVFAVEGSLNLSGFELHLLEE